MIDWVAYILINWLICRYLILYYFKNFNIKVFLEEFFNGDIYMDRLIDSWVRLGASTHTYKLSRINSNPFISMFE